MINVGIITADSPDTDPSLQLLEEIGKQEKAATFVINPFSAIDKETVEKLDIVFPRISGHNEDKVARQINFYINLVKKYKLNYLGNLELMPTQKDKFIQSILAQKAGLLIPETRLLKDSDDFAHLVEELGVPFIVKACISYGGDDVFLISNDDEFRNLIKGRRYIVQKFIKLERTVDYRVYVIGGHVVCGLRRENDKKGEFRSNTKQGGKGIFFRPEEDLAKLALKYVKLTQIDLLSVDFIKKDDQYLFIEANDAFSVNIKDEYKKIIIAESILQYCQSKVLNPKGKKWLFHSQFLPELS